MRATLLLAVASSILIATPMAQAAVHGVDWDASGIAYTTDGRVSLITIHWNGCLGCFYGTYTVDLTDALGASATQSFFGQLSIAEYNILGSYWAINVATGQSLQPGVQFNINIGYQFASTALNPIHYIANAHTGTYQGMSFVVVNPADTWDFN